MVTAEKGQMKNYYINVVCPNGHASTLLRNRVAELAPEKLKQFEVLFEGTIEIPAEHCPKCQQVAAA